MNGHIPNGAIPNGVIPNGVIPNGMIPNGTIPNGNIPSGFMPSKLNPNGIPLHGMRHVDPLPEEVWDVFTSQERALYSLIMLPDNHHWFCATLRRWVVRLWTVPSFDNPRPGNRHCFAEYASYVIELCCWSLYFLPPCFIQPCACDDTIHMQSFWWSSVLIEIERQDATQDSASFLWCRKRALCATNI